MTFEGKRKSLAIVDLFAIESNLISVAKLTANTRICAVVKADAYGHGAVEISRMIEKKALAGYFGVATVEEAVELRQAGIKLPILLLGVTFSDQFGICIDNDICITLAGPGALKDLSEIAEEKGVSPRVHLIIDTGMGRIGAREEELEELTGAFKEKYTNVHLEGIFSHFSCASNKEYSNMQLEKFKRAAGLFESVLGRRLLKHMANSGAILNLPDSYFDMVRPGIIMYGYKPYDGSEIYKKEFRPSMKFRTEISFIKYVKKGSVISYGADTRVEEDCYIATLPLGYADGISRSLSNKMELRIEGRSYMQTGRVTMDQIMINLGQDSYPVGTEVLVFDTEGYTANEYADNMGTIPYEVTCNLSRRVKRYYIK